MNGRRRRWHRVVIPYAVVIALFVLTGVAHALQEPDFAEAGTLSPTGTGPDGSSRLAALLEQADVTVERHTRSVDAVRSALRGDATVLVPRPEFPDPNLVRLLSTLPVDTRVVLVEPGQRDQPGVPLTVGLTRWASRASEPACTLPAARQAGRAAALRTRYAVRLPGWFSCYEGGLVGVRWQQLDLVVVGATDPFRNSRIDEHGNAALAVGLLSTHRRVIWLDLHGPEPVSYSTVETESLHLDLPDEEDTADEEQEDQAAPPSPLWTAVPPLFWPILVQLALVALLLALWRARRLGPPVPEPLPVLVPAAETVTGRGRLYERADARGPALDALRTAARQRILPALGLPPDAAEAEVVDTAAQRAGMPPEQVWAILYGAEPPDDDRLMAAVADLDGLVAKLTKGRRTGR